MLELISLLFLDVGIQLNFEYEADVALYFQVQSIWLCHFQSQMKQKMYVPDHEYISFSEEYVVKLLISNTMVAML